MNFPIVTIDSPAVLPTPQDATTPLTTAPAGVGTVPVPRYRIALMGLSGSGKTCLLAALALRRRQQTEGYSCQWIEEPSPAQVDDPQRFVPGKQWLQRARERLRGGAVPEPNADLRSQYHLLFDFTTPEQRPFQVEIIDYAGELIHTTANDPLVARLRAAMASMDAVLVVAEVPRSEVASTEAGESLQRLQQAFVALRDETRRDGVGRSIPVGLLLSKLDRLGQVEPTEAGRREQLERFYQEHPAFGDLRDHVQGSVGSAEDFHDFGVSALGREFATVECETNSPNERSEAVQPLASVGLDEPFVWSVLRRDQLDVERFAARAQQRRWWRIWGRHSPGRLVAEGKRLEQRLPPTSASLRSIRNLLGPCRKAQLWLRGVFVMLAVVFLAAFVSWRQSERMAAQVRIADDEYRQIEADVQKLIVGRIKDNSQTQTLEKRLRALLATGQLAADQARKAQVLQAQLQSHQEKQWQAEAEQRNRENQEWLRKGEKGLRLAQEQEGEQREPALEEFRKHLEGGLPHLDSAEKELLDECVRLKEQYDRAVEAVGRARREDQLRNTYHALLDSGKVREAARVLRSYQHQEAEALKELLKHFQTRAVDVLESQVRELEKSYKWDDARSYLNQQADGDEVVALVDSTQWKRVRQLAPRIDEKQDRYLYERLRQLPKRERLNRYLQEAPCQSMQNAARTLEKYLDIIEDKEEITCKLELEIRWGDSCWQGQNRVAVWVDDTVWISWNENEKVRSTHGTSSKLAPRAFPARAKVTAKQSIYVQIWYEGSGLLGTGLFAQEGTNGKGSASYTILDWHRDGGGRTMYLGEPHGIEVLIKVQGIPPSPKLPDWGK